jgi:hypothetical protein
VVGEDNKTVGVDNGYTSLDCHVHSLVLDRIDSFRGWPTVQCTRIGQGKVDEKDETVLL